MIVIGKTGRDKPRPYEGINYNYPRIYMLREVFVQTLFMINIACLTTGLATKTVSNVLKGRNKYPWQGNVKVQGMCIFFLIMPLAQTWLMRHE